MTELRLFAAELRADAANARAMAADLDRRAAAMLFLADAAEPAGEDEAVAREAERCRAQRELA